VDDQFETFDLLSGSGEPVSDPAAWGQTAFRLGIPADETESSAWVWTTDFLKAMPLVAYVRLKVADNSAAEEVARVAVTGGETLSLPGTAFQAADTYQEFPLSFTWPADEPFLTFQFWRSGSTELYIDAISIFTAPQTTSPTMNWPVPGGNYRGQNVWVRYTDGADQFSTIIEAESIKPILLVKPDSHILVASLDGRPTPVAIFRVEGRCPPLNWQAESSASWLQLENLGSTLRAGVDISALTPGHYTTTITVSSTETPGVAPVTIPITLWVFEQSQTIYLPLLQRQ
jgi:hypothetical protein